MLDEEIVIEVIDEIVVSEILLQNDDADEGVYIDDNHEVDLTENELLHVIDDDEVDEHEVNDLLELSLDDEIDELECFDIDDEDDDE